MRISKKTFGIMVTTALLVVSFITQSNHAYGVLMESTRYTVTSDMTRPAGTERFSSANYSVETVTSDMGSTTGTGTGPSVSDSGSISHTTGFLQPRTDNLPRIIVGTRSDVIQPVTGDERVIISDEKFSDKEGNQLDETGDRSPTLVSRNNEASPGAVGGWIRSTFTSLAHSFEQRGPRMVLFGVVLVGLLLLRVTPLGKKYRPF